MFIRLLQVIWLINMFVFPITFGIICIDKSERPTLMFLSSAFIGFAPFIYLFSRAAVRYVISGK